MPPENLHMYDDQADIENSQLFEVLPSDGPQPMEISLADSPAATDSAAGVLEPGEDDSKGSYTVSALHQPGTARCCGNMLRVGRSG
jgi:hypothetical protein